MYSVREEIKQYGLDTVLAAIRDAGFNCVELAGVYDLSPDELKAKLDKYGLQAYSAHIRADLIAEHIPYITALGIERVYVPWLAKDDLFDEAKFAQKVEQIRAMQAELDKLGVTLGYHNHNQEYASGADKVYEFMELIPGLTAEVDIFWVTMAGLKPMDVITKYGERLSAVHIKEMDNRITTDPREFPQAIPGEGKSDTKNVCAKARAMGVDLFVLECEGFPCDYKEYLKLSLERMAEFCK